MLACCLPLNLERSSVIGYDVKQDRVDELRKGLDKTLECKPDDLNAARYLTYSCDESELSGCGVFIITVPTPIDTANRPDLSPLESASEMGEGT